jgi:hypothetical protein
VNIVLLKRRPTTVEAMRVTRENRIEVAVWCKGHPVFTGVGMTTNTGDVAYAKVGDWVLRGPDGSFYPAPQAVIDSSYEELL